MTTVVGSCFLFDCLDEGGSFDGKVNGLVDLLLDSADVVALDYARFAKPMEATAWR